MIRPRALLVLSAPWLACASAPEVNPSYAPTENVLEVVAVLRRHVPDDTYRFEPARDVLPRSSQIEQLHDITCARSAVVS